MVQRPWLPDHTRRGRRAVSAQAFLLAALAWPGLALAEGDTQPNASSGDAPTAQDEPTATDSKMEILARASYAQVHVGLLQVGIEGMYMLRPRLGFGGVVEGFVVDNGADPHYSAPHTLSGGFHFLGLVEGDLLKGWVTPYARFGLGLGQYARINYGRTESQTELAAHVAAGIALRGGPFLFRGWLAPSLYGGDFVLAYGAGLGARF